METIVQGDCSVHLVSASFRWPQDIMPSHPHPVIVWVFWEGRWGGDSATGWGEGSPGLSSLSVSKDREEKVEAEGRGPDVY